jgi:hypothetical protein
MVPIFNSKKFLTTMPPKAPKIGSAAFLRLDNSPDTFRALILNQSTEKKIKHQSIVNQ